ncbi:MAG: hypothetical protein QM808_06210 [Steroidobacteraceae bacterium]
MIAHDPEGRFDLPALLKQAQEWPGLEGMDLAKIVSRKPAGRLGRLDLDAGAGLSPPPTR